MTPVAPDPAAVDPFEVARAELVEGLARMVNRVIQHGKAEAQSALGSIKEIRTTLAGVANIDDFLEDLDAAERTLRPVSVDVIPVHARGADGGAGAGINRLEAPGLSRGDNEIDGATAALRAHKASGPISDGKIGAMARGLFAGIDVDVAPAIVAPGPQQQIRFCRRAERCRPCGAFVALSPHGAPSFSREMRLGLPSLSTLTVRLPLAPAHRHKESPAVAGRDPISRTR